MHPALFLIFNHELTHSQEEDAIATLGIRSISDLPPDLKALWRQIPAELPALHDYLAPIMTWLETHGEKGDYVLIQGDFGACYNLVNFTFHIGLIPIYSTTERKVVEERGADGTVKMTHQFKHRIFRRYGV